MTNNLYSSYPLVDTTVGTRLVLGFIVPATALELRLPQPWQLSSLPASYLSALGLNGERPPEQPNLMLVFNDLLLNQEPARRAARGWTRSRRRSRRLPRRNQNCSSSTHLCFFAAEVLTVRTSP